MKKLVSRERKKILNEIQALEHKQSIQFSSVKDQFRITSKSLKPSEIITKTVLDLYQEPRLQGSVGGSIISLITGLISRKAIVGKSNSTFKSLLGYIVQYVTTKIVATKINQKKESV